MPNGRFSPMEAHLKGLIPAASDLDQGGAGFVIGSDSENRRARQSRTIPDIACDFKTIRMNHNFNMLPSPPVD
jgi:hypothetical protein